MNYLMTGFYKLTVIVFVLLFFLGCVNFSSNKRACENADFLLPLPYSFIGNIFQIGPCTAFEPFRIEIGVELKGLRGGVEMAVRDGQKNYELDSFAMKMGCQSAVIDRLLKLLVENKYVVFGETFEKTNRQVVKAVREITLFDLELRKGCW